MQVKQKASYQDSTMYLLLSLIWGNENTCNRVVATSLCPFNAAKWRDEKPSSFFISTIWGHLWRIFSVALKSKIILIKFNKAYNIGGFLSLMWDGVVEHMTLTLEFPSLSLKVILESDHLWLVPGLVGNSEVASHSTDHTMTHMLRSKKQMNSTDYRPYYTILAFFTHLMANLLIRDNLILISKSNSVHT